MIAIKEYSMEGINETHLLVQKMTSFVCFQQCYSFFGKKHLAVGSVIRKYKVFLNDA